MYPVQFSADYTRQPSRLSTFFRMIIVIPWMIVAVVYGIAVMVTALIAWFALLIVGRYPNGLYEFNSGILRFGVRVNAFTYLLTDRAPSFGIGEENQYPVRLAIAPRAERQSRLKVLFRLILAFPLYVIAYPISYILQSASLIAWLTIVFRGYNPVAIHQILSYSNAWSARTSAYMLLLTDAFPPVGDDPLTQSPEAIDPREVVPGA